MATDRQHIKHQAAVVALCGLGLLLSVVPRSARAIDCAKPASVVEKAICGDAAVREIDAQLTQALGKEIEAHPEKEDEIWFDQRHWLDVRDAHCERLASKMHECLLEVYRARLSTAGQPLSVKSAENSLAQLVLSPAALEKDLLEALKVDKTGFDRRGDPGRVITEYAAAQLIDGSRPMRSDFDDYYALRKSAQFLGHKLVVIEWGHGRDDSIDGPTGCCVRLGLTVYVRVNGDDANLARFAKTNRCDYDPDLDFFGFWKQMIDAGSGELPPQEHPPIRLPKGRYARLECTDYTLEYE